MNNLVRDAPGPSGPDDSACRHPHSLELVEGVADRRGDFTWLVNVPGEATDVVALAHRQDQHVGT
jgi:chemotaxis signal transduction protein